MKFSARENNKTKISVCMAVYNGEKYLFGQLESLYGQTCPADEVVICDDRSTDNTAAIIERFIRDRGLEDSWKLYVNGENRGYPLNFYHSMSLCGGDLVFPADQDDIWELEKLERMRRVMEAHPEARLLGCRYAMMDGEGREIRALVEPGRSRDADGGRVRAVSPEAVFYRYEWPGMALACRGGWLRELLGEIKDSPALAKLPHDFLLCVRAAEEGSFLQMEETLVRHRRHDGNAGGEEHRAGRLLSRERKLKEIADYREILEAFRQAEILRTEPGRKLLEEKDRIMGERYDALLRRRTMQVLKAAWRNRDRVRPATAVCDLLITLLRRE